MPESPTEPELSDEDVRRLLAWAQTLDMRLEPRFVISLATETLALRARVRELEGERERAWDEGAKYVVEQMSKCGAVPLPCPNPYRLSPPKEAESEAAK